MLHRLVYTLSILIATVMGTKAQSTDCKVLHSKLDSFYTGQCKDGLAHGKGTAIAEDIYQGEFKNGYPSGQGRYIWERGKKTYKGHFKDGKLHGKGKLIFKRNNEKDSIVKGKWINGEMTKRITKEDPYKVIRQKSVNKINIYNEGSGNAVYVYFKRYGGSSNDYYIQTVDVSSGFKRLDSNPIEVKTVEFPFNCNINFRAPNALGANIHDCRAEFTINKPGKYRVIINY